MKISSVSSSRHFSWSFAVKHTRTQAYPHRYIHGRRQRLTDGVFLLFFNAPPFSSSSSSLPLPFPDIPTPSLPFPRSLSFPYLFSSLPFFSVPFPPP